jgi:tripartite-type tricarboxylate transporter receptor subunit TctC
VAIEILNSEVHKAMRLPEMIDTMKAVGFNIALSTPEELGRLIEAEIQRWGKVVRALNLKSA